MHVITTKTLAPTRTKGTRIKAKCWCGTVKLAWDHSMGPSQNHKAAAELLLESINADHSNGTGWTIVSSGILPGVSGFAFVIAGQ